MLAKPGLSLLFAVSCSLFLSFFAFFEKWHPLELVPCNLFFLGLPTSTERFQQLTASF